MTDREELQVLSEAIAQRAEGKHHNARVAYYGMAKAGDNPTRFGIIAVTQTHPMQQHFTGEQYSTWSACERAMGRLNAPIFAKRIRQ